MKCPKCENEMKEDGKRYFIKYNIKYCETWGFCFGNGKNHLGSIFIPISKEIIK